jgi:hypothetical protein
MSNANSTSTFYNIQEISFRTDRQTAAAALPIVPKFTFVVEGHIKWRVCLALLEAERLAIDWSGGKNGT